MNNYLSGALKQVDEKSFTQDGETKFVVSANDAKNILLIFDAQWKSFLETEIDRRVNSKLVEEMETRKMKG